jgi:hypothetical protein
MSYQPNQYQSNMGETVQPAPWTLNKWWPIGFAIASVVLYAIGGGLYGSYGSSCVGYGYSYYCSTGLWSGGIAMLSLGGVTMTIAIILLFIYLIRRQNPIQWNSGTRLTNQSQYAPQPPANIQPPRPAYQTYQPTKPEADIREIPQNPPMMEARYCGHCGTLVQSAFCPKCGAQV